MIERQGIIKRLKINSRLKLDTNTMNLICDTESNGLKFEATRLWCGVAYCPENNTTWYSVDDEFYQETNVDSSLVGGALHKITNREYVDLLQIASSVVFHNGYNHDLPLLRKLYPGFSVKGLEDTFVLSSLFWPDRPSPRGWVGKPKPHSIEAWAMRFGKQKVGQEQWEVFEENMLTRCIEDVKIGYKVFKELSKERSSWDWESAIELEYKVAELQGIQEMNGVMFDVELADEVIKKIDKEVEEIDEKLYKLLPIRCVNDGEVKKPFKKDGEFTQQVIKFMGAQ